MLLRAALVVFVRSVGISTYIALDGVMAKWACFGHFVMPQRMASGALDEQGLLNPFLDFDLFAEQGRSALYEGV